MRHRGPAQRGQVDAFQLPLQRKGPGGQLPLLHDRTQRGRHHRARPAAHPPGRNRQPQTRHPHDDRDRRHRGSGQGRLEGRGAGQQVPGQHPQHERHHPRAALLRQRQHHARRRSIDPCATRRSSTRSCSSRTSRRSRTAFPRRRRRPRRAATNRPSGPWSCSCSTRPCWSRGAAPAPWSSRRRTASWSPT